MSTLYCELGYLARRNLSLVLDHESTQGRDWMGLGDRMGFTYDVVRQLRDKTSPTLALLEEWEKAAGSEATLDRLIELLESLNCKEAVDVLNREKAVRKQSTNVLKISASSSTTNSSYDRSRLRPHPPITPHNSIDPTHLDPAAIKRIQQVQVSVNPSQVIRNLEGLAVNESSQKSHTQQKEKGNQAKLPGSKTTPTSSSASSQSGSGGIEEGIRYVQSQQFDVFLSYAEQDESFAEEVRVRLVDIAKLKVFVPSSGLMAGKVFHREIADMIKSRCTKTVIILSPDYLRSPWCNYESNLAIMKSPDVSVHSFVPILYRQCEIPGFLSIYCYLDYPCYKDDKQKCESHIWEKLYMALTY